MNKIRNDVQIKVIIKCTDLDFFIEINSEFGRNLFLIAGLELENFLRKKFFKRMSIKKLLLKM